VKNTWFFRETLKGIGKLKVIKMVFFFLNIYIFSSADARNLPSRGPKANKRRLLYKELQKHSACINNTVFYRIFNKFTMKRRHSLEASFLSNKSIKRMPPPKGGKRRRQKKNMEEVWKEGAPYWSGTLAWTHY